MKIIRFFYSILIVLCCSVTYAEDTCQYKISLVTLSPGDEIYTVFGHSALRVQDSGTKDDLIYNYGTFDFGEPNFLSKFINGKLLYYLSNEDFIPFIQTYQQEGRTITEQVLNLSCTQKKNIIAYLYNNLQGDHKFYKYDFISDNCTTRLRDLLEKTTSTKIDFKRVVHPNAYYRQLLHADLDYHDHQWIKLGIDLLLGSRTDKIMSNEEVMFLPDYLLASAGNATIDNKPLVSVKKNLSYATSNSFVKSFVLNPLFIFSLFAVIIISLSFSGNYRIESALLRLDSLLLFISGLAGFIFVYLWVCSDQLNYRDNYNLLWAWPTHLVISFFYFKSNSYLRNYLKATSLIYCLLLLSWYFLPQHLNISLIPLIIIMILRFALKGFSFSLNSVYARVFHKL